MKETKGASKMETESADFLTVKGVRELLRRGWFLMRHDTYFWLIRLPDQTPFPRLDDDKTVIAYSTLLYQIWIKLQPELEARAVDGAKDMAGEQVGRVYRLIGVESEYWEKMPDEGTAFGVVYPFSYRG